MNLLLAAVAIVLFLIVVVLLITPSSQVYENYLKDISFAFNSVYWGVLDFDTNKYCRCLIWQLHFLVRNRKFRRET